MVMTAERTLGQKIRRARERKGWAQHQLAEALGVHTLTVSAWETDERPPRVSIRPRLWSVLGLTPDDFDTDPHPGGGSRSRRRRTDHHAHQGAAVAQGPTLAELAARAVNELASYVPLDTRRDMAKDLTAGLAQWEAEGNSRCVELARQLLTKPTPNTAYSLALLAYAFRRYLANRNSTAAAQEVDTVIEGIDAIANVA